MRTLALAATIAALAAPLPASAQALSEDQVRALVLETIRENPEIVMEAVAILQEREAAAQAEAARATLEQNRPALERDVNAPVIGNPDGDVTVVEFFDYNCPYCRRAGTEVEALLAADPNVRVVYREWPILGEGSVVATRAALAAREQGLYEEMHKALMGARARLDDAKVMEIAGTVGLDLDQLRIDMESPEIDAHIATSMALAESLGFSGTPSFVIGDALAPGMITADEMAAMVAAARGEPLPEAGPGNDG